MHAQKVNDANARHYHSLSLIRSCYNTNSIDKSMNQRSVSTENISYNLVDYTETMNLETIEE